MKVKLFYTMLFGACLASCSSEEVISLESGDTFLKDGIGYVVIDNSQKNQAVEAVSCGGGDVVIPSTVEYGGKAYQVESVGLQADQPVTSLTLSEGIRSLERIVDGAGGSYIRKLVLPGSMMNVGEYGTSDEPGQFHLNVDCLEVIDVADGNPMYGCGDRKNVLIYKPFQSLIMGNSSAYIPQGVKTICGNAFCWSEQYDKPVVIDISEGVETIEYEAFKAPIISSIRIPSSVTDVLEGAFNGDHLQSLVIEDSSEQLHFRSRYGMFARCIVPYSYMVDTSLNLDEIYVGRNTQLFVLNAFSPSETMKLKTLTIGPKVTSLNWLTYDEWTISRWSVDTIVSHTEHPDEVYPRFPETVFKNTTLIVPTGTKQLYQSVEGWKDFSVIMEEAL